MTIKFKKKRLYINLILGAIWIVLGIINLLADENLKWNDYGYLVVGILYLGHFLYDLNNQYLKIKNGIIQKNVLYGFGKKLKLKEINRIQKFADEYILRTAEKKLQINPNFIDEKSLEEFKEILQNLNLPKEKDSFSYQ